MSREEREPDLATRSSPRPPDTEREHPPTPATESYPKAGVPAPAVVPDAPKTLGAPGDGPSDPGATDGNLFRDTLQDEKPPHEAEVLGAGGPPALQTMRSIPQAADVSNKSSHTTLQSMKRPEEVPGEVPHSRRFLRIENDLDQARANIKLLKKAVEKAQRDARLAWIVALLAGIIAGAALTR
jgi:hypothetical protein